MFGQVGQVNQEVMTKIHRIVFLTFIPIFCGFNKLGAIHLESFKTHGRFLFQIDQATPVEWKSDFKGFKLIFKGISVSDLGAGLGSEEQWKTQVEHLTDPRLKSIKIKEKVNSVELSGSWKFPQGKWAYAKPEMEVFQYRQDHPDRYVVDFWYKEGPSVEQALRRKNQTELVSISNRIREHAKAIDFFKKKRLEQEAELIDPKRFCERPLDEKYDVILRFNPVHDKFDFSKWLPTNVPDKNYEYKIPTENDKQSQYVRLAYHLYSKDDPALTLRAIEFYEQEFRHNLKYQLEMKFLKSSALVRLGYTREAESLLRGIMVDSPGSEEALRAALYLVSKYMAKSLNLQILSTFMWLSEHYQNHSLVWVFHLGAAEAMYDLGQTERAGKEYRWLIENSPDPGIKAEASRRIGDLYLNRFQYEQALASYHQSEKYFPDQIHKDPAYYLNVGETLFHLKDYKQASEYFKNYLDKSFAHKSGWRATFRLAEITAIDGISEKDPSQIPNKAQENARVLYYETVNRFPYSLGATLARMRLFPCPDYGKVSFESQQRFYGEDAEAISDSGELSPVGLPEFKSITHLRSVISLGTKDQVVYLALSDSKIIKMDNFKSQFNFIAHSFTKMHIEALLENKSVIEALRFYDNIAPKLPKTDETIDISYLLKLAEAATNMGFYRVGLALIQEYDSKKLAHVEIDLDLSHRAFLEAKLIWALNGLAIPTVSSNAPVAPAASATPVVPNTGSGTVSSTPTLAPGQWVQDIRSLLANVKDGLPDTLGKEILLGMLNEKEKKFHEAIMHASRAQLMNRTPAMDAWLARIYEESNDIQGAASVFKQAQKEQSKSSSNTSIEQSLAASLGIPSDPTKVEMVSIEGELLSKLGKSDQAEELYKEASQEFKDNKRFQFYLAKTLLETHNRLKRNRAKEILEDLSQIKFPDNDPNLFWKEMAQSTLANLKIEQTINNDAKEGNHD